MLGERYSVADISLYAYVSVAHEAGFDLREHPSIGAWLKRVESTPGFMNDFEAYPPNSQLGQSKSIYD
jgi:glutathione S-transferase